MIAMKCGLITSVCYSVLLLGGCCRLDRSSFLSLLLRRFLSFILSSVTVIVSAASVSSSLLETDQEK